MSEYRPGQCPVRNHPLRGELPAGRAARVGAVVYGMVSYLLFVAVMLYLVGFVMGIAVPHTVDRAVEAPPAQAIIVDVGLLTVFALQHSVMARPGFKRWWTRYIPAPIERSTYVLLANAALALVFWQWRSIDTTIWSPAPAPARIALIVLAAFGWLSALASTFMIDHFDLFGLSQVLRLWRTKPQGEKSFREVFGYRLVRHPLMLGFLIAFWAAPTMTAGHLVFALTTTVYVLIAIRIEERDLLAELGEPYRRYRARVPMLLPGLRLRLGSLRTQVARSTATE
jgi:protein-S-isoprenylcysteine O-methyltransferase Ste14